MAIIKIISNPYSNSVLYQRWDYCREDWIPIDAKSNPASPLISDDLATGFFPFKVERIVETILNLYAAPTEKLELRFEGPRDEYESLVSACEDKRFRDSIIVSNALRHLQNARDVLPKAVSVYGELRPLILEGAKDDKSVESELNRYSDASSNVIPICVVGNYSSGKSTFINALLGAEFLPAGEVPVTEKIFRITRCIQKNSARIGFELDGRPMSLQFDGGEMETIGLLADDPLNKQLMGLVGKSNDRSLVSHVNMMLEVLNGAQNDSTTGRVSELITVEVPFSDEGLLGNSDNEFMIFDTPGPNSVSLAKHEVLKTAMENLSNGIPVFVSEYSALDSTDNQKLYSELKTIDGLDSRFTMIVVSKADHADLPKEGFTDKGVQRIRDQAVVRNLYAEGIYFVSSLIGLGAKNGGQFLSDHLYREYSIQEEMYLDAGSRFYTCLYKYDILPEEIKREVTNASEECSNKQLANSGLYSVEKEIQTFAWKYASYNKCRQIEKSLDNAYLSTKTIIEQDEQQLQDDRSELEEKLESAEKELIGRIESTSFALERAAERKYQAVMAEHVSGLRKHLCAQELKERAQDILDDRKQQEHLDDEIEDVHEALRVSAEGLQRSLKGIVDNHDLAALKTAQLDFSRDMGKVLKELDDVGQAEANAKSSAINELLAEVNESASTALREALESTDGKSEEYWIEKSEILKKELTDVVAGSSDLSEKAKSSLVQVIITFSQITFPEHEAFKADEFLIHPFEMVHKAKLAEAYNDRINNALDSSASEMEQNHTNSFVLWKNRLVDTLRDNITDFNPDLHRSVVLISKDEAKIYSLRQLETKILTLVSEVKNMIDWTERESK